MRQSTSRRSSPVLSHVAPPPAPTSTLCPAQFYVDGGLIKEGDAFDLTQTDTQPITIGKRNLEGYDGTWFHGYIDEVRLSKVARYTGPFTPSNAAFDGYKNQARSGARYFGSANIHGSCTSYIGVHGTS